MSKQFKVDGSLHMTGGAMHMTIEKNAVAMCLWQEVVDLIGWAEDDAGCDWATDDKGGTWIVFSEPQKVSDLPLVKTLVDAANYMQHGQVALMVEGDCVWLSKNRF